MKTERVEKKHLSLWDTVSLIVGIVVGAGIYETAPLVFSSASSPAMAMGVWALGGVLSLIGALCYAELASAYPRTGGDYVYLTRAFGSWTGFLFGWAQLAVIFTGSIAMMAFVFADYGAALWGLGPGATLILAVIPVAVLSLMNVVLSLGRRTQNVFTLAKILGFLVVIGVGFWASGSAPSGPFVFSGETEGFHWGSFGLAMVFVLYTYGGWNDAAFVASELKDRRLIPLTLILGTLIISLLYFVVNLAYLQGLGFEAARHSRAIAADLLRGPFGPAGSAVISVLVMISALGAVNGLIFTGARLYSALGADHQVFARLGRWSTKFHSPVASLAAQGAVSVALLLLVGSETGRGSITALSTGLGFAAPQWQGHGGFDTLLRCTAPVFWGFFLLTGLSVFILRYKDPHLTRPFRVPLYPLTPILFCATSAYMLYRSITYAGGLTLVGLVLLFAGTPLYFLGRRPVARVLPLTEPAVAPATSIKSVG